MEEPKMHITKSKKEVYKLWTVLFQLYGILEKSKV